MILFVSYVKAAVSVEANFSDPQCDGGMVCPNDPLLYTCTITETPISQTTIRLPFGYDLNIRTENEITVVGVVLPTGVTLLTYEAIVDEGLANYTITLPFERASLLTGGIICDSTFDSIDESTCPSATGSYS